MAEFTNLDLKFAREAQNIPRWKMGTAIGVSESTIERWESGETLPSPDDVDRSAGVLRDPSIWHRWMLSNYDSYRKRYINGCSDNGLAAAMARLRFETGDLLTLQDSAERDSLDGKIDNTQLRKAYTKELQDVIAVASNLLQKLLTQ